MKWYQRPERMATIFFFGSIVAAIISYMIWRPLANIIVPLGLLIRPIYQIIAPLLGLPAFDAQVTDAQSDLLFIITGPIIFVCTFGSFALWAAFGYWIGSRLRQKS